MTAGKVSEMGDVIRKLNITEKLRGKGNFQTWTTAMKMDLRGQKLADTITQNCPATPSTRDEGQLTERVKDWLTGNNECPGDGFSTAKINGNKALYKMTAQKDCKEFIELSQIAL